MLKNIMPSFLTETDDDEAWEALSPEEQKAAIEKEEREFRMALAPKTGPRGGVQFRTNGQVRRQRIRDAKRAKRKGQARFNRSWMADHQTKANIRGQILVLSDARFEGTAMRANVERAMDRRYRAAVQEYVDAGMDQGKAEKQVEIDMLQAAQ